MADDLFRRSVSSVVDRHDRFATTEGLWQAALTRGLRAPSFRLVRAGAAVDGATRRAGIGHRTVDDVIQPNRALELHAGGATMVLQGLQFTDPHLARVANNLALELDQPVQVNAYLSPAAARGLELHFDYHDVFVLQLAGHKRWRVWDPLERTHQPVRAGPRVAMPTLDELGPPTLDRTLDPGECLYLPRGFPHAAETVDSASSHLTIGILALQWHQAVRHAVDRAVAAGALRASISTDGPDDDPTVDGLDAVAAHLDAAAVRRWVAVEVWRRQPATRLRPLCPPPVGADTPLEITPGPLLWATVEGDRARLGLGDRTLSLPVEALPMLAAVLSATGPFTVGRLDLGDEGELDDGSRLVVARRLAVEGVVRPAG